MNVGVDILDARLRAIKINFISAVRVHDRGKNQYSIYAAGT